MERIDLSADPAASSMLVLLRELTSADSPQRTLGSFMARYHQLRGIRYFVGVVPDASDPTAYRLHYFLGPREMPEAPLHLPEDVAVPGPSDRPLLRGGLIGECLRDPLPKAFHNLDLSADPALASIAPDVSSCLALPILDGPRVNQWALGFGSPQMRERTTSHQMIESWLSANMLGIANRYSHALTQVDRLTRTLRDQIDGVARVQEALLPGSLPDINGHTVASAYLTSEQAGGDYFGFERVGDRWAMMISDVSGHGAAAATINAMLLGALIMHLQTCEASRRNELLAPAAIAGMLNRVMVGVDIDSSFATAIFMMYDPASGRMIFSNSGHNPPLLWRARERRVITIDTGATMPLGILHPHDPVEDAFTIEPGDTLLLYTDGIVELFDPARAHQFGLPRLREALADAAMHNNAEPTSVIDRIFAGLYAHRGSSTRDDDQTLVVIQRST